MKNRNLSIFVVTAVTLCLMSANVFAAGGLEADAESFFTRIVDLILLIAPYAVAIAIIIAAFLIPTRGWSMFGMAIVAGFIVGGVKLWVEFSSGMTL